ncbi:hypothetical protein BH09BAC1_BH09BAC1_07910 [soil metagenome]
MLQGSKVYRALSHLAKPELEELDKQLSCHKRSSIFQLFTLLKKPAIKQQPEPSKEDAFAAVYKKPYTKEEDYLLRNEYRLLFKEVVRFISTQEWNRQPEHRIKIKYLEYLLQKEQYELLEEEINEALATARKNNNLEFLLALYDMKISYNIHSKPQSLANAEETLALSTERAGMLQTELLQKLRTEEIRIKMCERIVKAYKPHYEPLPFINAIELMPLQHKDVYAQYLYKRAQINLVPPQERIAILKDILSAPHIIEQYELEPQKALARFYVVLAQECYIQGEYQNSFEYFALAMPLMKLLPADTRDAFVYNYLMALLKGGQQEKAATIGAQYKAAMLLSPVLKNRAAFLFVMLYLFNRQPDEAERHIDLESKADGTEFYYHMRLALSYVYYLRGQLELAERECNNLEQALNYELRKEGNSQVALNKTLNKMFRRFYALRIEGQATGMKELAEPLRDLMANIRSTSGFDSVFVQLLEDEI